MNIIDIAIVVVVGIGLLIGLRSGLIKQVLGITGLFVAFVLSFYMMGPVGELVSGILGVSQTIGTLIGFALVFLTVEIGILFLTRILDKIVSLLRLTPINRVLGGIVGGLKAALVLSIVFLVLDNVGLPSEDTRAGSVFYAEVSTVLPRTWDVVTDVFPRVTDLAEQFQEDVSGMAPQ